MSKDHSMNITKAIYLLCNPKNISSSEKEEIELKLKESFWGNWSGTFFTKEVPSKIKENKKPDGMMRSGGLSIDTHKIKLENGNLHSEEVETVKTDGIYYYSKRSNFEAHGYIFCIKNGVCITPSLNEIEELLL